MFAHGSRLERLPCFVREGVSEASELSEFEAVLLRELSDQVEFFYGDVRAYGAFVDAAFESQEHGLRHTRV